MLEVYEVDADPRLAYLAVRGLPDSNGNALDVGFVVSGTDR